MLIELNITDFAIIDKLHLSFTDKLNIFTGETGAGKSIIIDAIGALLGERISAEVVRTGAERSFVEGIFDVSSMLNTPSNNSENAEGVESDQSLQQILQIYDLTCEDGYIILGREIQRNGKSIARINGRAFPISTLQAISSYLVDIHGQGEHLSLLKPSRHISLLDDFAHLNEKREQVTQLFHSWQQVKGQIENIQTDESKREQQIDTLKFQIHEIQSANLQQGEIETLTHEKNILSNSEKIGELSQAILGWLEGMDESPSATDMLKAASQKISDLAHLDPSLDYLLEKMNNIVYELEDATGEIKEYTESIEYNPERLGEILDRLALIDSLRRKYGSNIEEILLYLDKCVDELETFENKDSLLESLLQDEIKKRTSIGYLAGELSLTRRLKAKELSQQIEQHLQDLHMPKTKFQVDIQQEPETNGAILEGLENVKDFSLRSGEYKFSKTGIDTVEFLIAPNIGESFKPLAKIASGGETSRFMLALKTALTNIDKTPTLIFDEIDTGISGAAANAVARKLSNLSENHQVICITHLPQLAAMADNHIHVSKAVQGNRTVTLVSQLTDEQRIEELAIMLSGEKTTSSMTAAAEIIETASDWKEKASKTAAIRAH